MSDKRFFFGRRDFLRQTLTLIPAVTLSGPLLSTATLTLAEETKDTPRFFDDREWAFINKAVDLLIPEDDNGPGALKAGVPAYIDGQMESPYGYGRLWYMQAPFDLDADPEFGLQRNLVPREIYRQGIAALNRWCQQQYSQTFPELDRDHQIDILEKLQLNEIDLQAFPASFLFSQLWQNTREGFFSDPIHGGNRQLVGWKLIGFPGARADFMDWADRGVEYPFPPVSINGERG